MSKHIAFPLKDIMIFHAYTSKSFIHLKFLRYRNAKEICGTLPIEKWIVAGFSLPHGRAWILRLPPEQVTKSTFK
jgi:hypothetical protein